MTQAPCLSYHGIFKALHFNNQPTIGRNQLSAKMMSNAAAYSVFTYKSLAKITFECK